ncbi:MAG TPA: NAD(P)/FAD-dependent oxidoreductase, partial [Pyrinomonadaceae bacterium]
MYTLTDVTNDPINFDVVIIGGGPAGMSAAIWCADLNLDCCLINDRAELGGQLHHIYNPIRNYLGTEFENGAQCSRQFHDSLEGLPIVLYPNTNVAAIDPSRMTVSTEQGRSFGGKAIVIATGLRRRELGVRGESEFMGNGILDSGARDPKQVRGHRVAVIGGGDAALENALILSDHAERVFLIHRRDSFAAREHFVSAATSKENIEFVLDSTVIAFEGNSELSLVELRDLSGDSRGIEVSRAVVRIG